METTTTTDRVLRLQKPEKEEEQGEEPSWNDRPLPGMYHRQTEEVANNRNENDRAKIRSDFEIQTDKVVMDNQPDIVDKQRKTAIVIESYSQ